MHPDVQDVLHVEEELLDNAKEDTVSTAASSLAEASLESAEVPTWPRKMIVGAPDHAFMVFGVFAFLPWEQRGDAMCISREMRNFFNADCSHGEYWRWHCDCLCAEAHLILPVSAQRPCSMTKGSRCSELVDYRALLAELWPLRFRFMDAVIGQVASAAPQRFRVSVSCRLRPAPPAAPYGGLCEEMLSAPVTLPLGQRVALLRQRHPELTRAQAMKMLLNAKCGAAGPLEEYEGVTMQNDMADLERPKTGSAGVAVMADVAFSSGSGFNASVLSSTPGPAGSVLTVSPGIGIRKWNFENVFGESTPQHGIYDTCGKRLSTNVLNGLSGCLIVYGQTGSGKTHTMFGGERVRDGVVPRIAEDILQAVEAKRSAGFKIKVGASIIEVFGNDVSNLLGKTGVAKLCQRMGTKHVLDGKYERGLDDLNSFEALLCLGEERKRKAHTEMNERSTRAHTLVILRLRQQAPGQEKMVESILSLVDLGGSERVGKSKANEGIRGAGAVNVGDEEVSRVTWSEYYKSRERITETNNINKGLLSLKRCVQALNECQARAADGRPVVRVPYADSKLTALLQPALSGEALTSIIVCASQEDRHAEETVQSLRFGEMCSSVEHNRAEVAGSDIGVAMADAIAQIDLQIKEVEDLIRSKEKWEWRKTTRTDIIDEKDTGGTVCHKDQSMELGGVGVVVIAADDGSSKKQAVAHEVWSQVLVGAEAENARRDELIKTRLRLLGD